MGITRTAYGFEAIRRFCVVLLHPSADSRQGDCTQQVTLAPDDHSNFSILSPSDDSKRQDCHHPPTLGALFAPNSRLWRLKMPWFVAIVAIRWLCRRGCEKARVEPRTLRLNKENQGSGRRKATLEDRPIPAAVERRGAIRPTRVNPVSIPSLGYCVGVCSEKRHTGIL